MKAKVKRKTLTLKDYYSRWLSQYGFTHFVTLTTPYELTLNSSRRLVERFHNKLKEQGFEPNTFFVTEKFEVKDGYHLHLLLKINKSKLEKHEFKFICELYQRVAGTSKVGLVEGKIKYLNWARIDLQKYLKTKGAGYYVTKYILKENSNKHAEYDFLI